MRHERTSYQNPGPARNLRRVREQVATIEDVQGLFGSKGPAHTIVITLPATGDTAAALRVTLNRAAWEELEDRMTTASVFFLDRRLPEKEPPPKTSAAAAAGETTTATTAV